MPRSPPLQREIKQHPLEPSRALWDALCPCFKMAHMLQAQFEGHYCFLENIQTDTTSACYVVTHSAAMCITALWAGIAGGVTLWPRIRPWPVCLREQTLKWWQPKGHSWISHLVTADCLKGDLVWTQHLPGTASPHLLANWIQCLALGLLPSTCTGSEVYSVYWTLSRSRCPTPALKGPFASS